MIFGVCISPFVASGQCPDVIGDVTGDQLANVVDVQCTILGAFYEVTENPSPDLLDCMGGEANLSFADLSCSGENNVVDVLLSISYALEKELNVSIDANQDNCPDACEVVQPASPTEPGSLEPAWTLEDVQPVSVGFGTSYGLDAVEGVTVVMLLASW
jgi:hypothetical protein